MSWKTGQEVCELNWKKRIKHLLGPVVALLFLGGVLGGLLLNNYAKQKAHSIQIKSQYTFDIRVDGNYELVGDEEIQEAAAMQGHPPEEKLVDIGRLWIEEYTSQFTQKFLPRSKALQNITVDEVALLDVNSQILKIVFSAELKDSGTEYFDSWNAMINEGRLICEWIVEFKMNHEESGVLRVSVKDISNSDGYSIQDNTWHLVESFKEPQTGKDANTEQARCRYEINNQSLNITYDGGKTWITVPVDVSAMLAGVNGKNALVAGSYIISEEKTAFLYGGTGAGTSVAMPLILLYSDDMGSNWTSAQVFQAQNVSSTYLQFINKKTGYVVYAHDKTAKSEKVEFLKTVDGGETWNRVGESPEEALINDIGYVSEEVGFICYEATEELPGRLYATWNGGAAFVKITLPLPQLSDYNEKSYNFEETFVSYEVPKLTNGILTLSVFQSDKGTYRNGKVYARFTSADYGKSWVYDGLYEKQ